MTNNSQPHNLEELLAGYVLGDLDETELIWLNEQLAVNPELRERVCQLEATLTLMPYGLPEDVPQTDLRSQILAQAYPKSQRRFQGYRFQGYRFQSYRWGWIISAITALTTLWFGVNNFNLRQQVVFQETQLKQQQELITSLRQIQNPNRLVTFQGVNASGILFISPGKKKAVLALQNLDSLPGKQVYRLWAVSPKQKTGCANFTPNPQGMVHLELSPNEDLINASSILITIEPKADTAQPLGNEFLTGSYSAI